MQDSNHFGTRCWVRQRSSRVVYSRNETSETHFPCAERNHLVALPMPGTGRSCRRVPSRATAARIADGSCADNSGPGQAGVHTCPRIDAHTSHHRHCDTATRAAAHCSGSAITHTTAHKHSATTGGDRHANARSDCNTTANEHSEPNCHPSAHA